MFNWFAPKVYNSGYLPEKDGHRIYFMEAGSKNGRPILMFHGGPGGCSRAAKAADFPRGWRLIMFDQRGAGKSLPKGEMQNNTTWNLLQDAERLLEYLDIKEQVVVYGTSWGSTLALLFAEQYPQKVRAMLLSKIFLADDLSAEWSEHYSSWFYPDIWQQLEDAAQDKGDIVAAYAKMINSADAAKQKLAAGLYGRYERVMGSLNPRLDTENVNDDDVAENKIYINYAAQKFMLKEGEILHHIDKVQHLPSLIVHNRLDMVCPLIGAYRLHQVLPQSKLVIVPAKGHGGKLHSAVNRREMRQFLRNLA